MGKGREFFSDIINNEFIETNKRADIFEGSELEVSKFGIQKDKPYLRVNINGSEFVLFKKDLDDNKEAIKDVYNELSEVMDVCFEDHKDEVEGFRLEKEKCRSIDPRRSLELDNELVFVSGDFWRLPRGVNGRIKNISGDDKESLVRSYTEFISELFESDKFFKNRATVPEEFDNKNVLDSYGDDYTTTGYRHYCGDDCYGVLPLENSIDVHSRRVGPEAGTGGRRWIRKIYGSEGFRIEDDLVSFYKRIVSSDFGFFEGSQEEINKRKHELDLSKERLEGEVDVDLEKMSSVFGKFKDRMALLSVIPDPSLSEDERRELVDNFKKNDPLSDIDEDDVKVDIDEILEDIDLEEDKDSFVDILGSGVRDMSKYMIKRILSNSVEDKVEDYFESYKPEDEKGMFGYRLSIASQLDAFEDNELLYEEFKKKIVDKLK